MITIKNNELVSCSDKIVIWKAQVRYIVKCLFVITTKGQGDSEIEEEVKTVIDACPEFL